MYILELLRNPLEAAAFLIALVAAVTVHEFAHAWTADRLGDDTPALQGRVTLDPRAHLDPLGSLFFLIAGFGWGKPVIYNPVRLSRRADELLIALAGPASNLTLALLFNGLIFLTGRAGYQPIDPAVLALVVQVNILLAAFNMLPVPPLDGSSIVAYFWPEYRSLVGGQIGMLLLLLLLASGAISALIGPIAGLFAWIASLFGLLA